MFCMCVLVVGYLYFNHLLERKNPLHRKLWDKNQYLLKVKWGEKTPKHRRGSSVGQWKSISRKYHAKYFSKGSV